MNWYRWRWWRLAWTRKTDTSKSKKRDPKGRWVRIWHGLYWRLSKQPVRRWLFRRMAQNCPHERMIADILEGDGSYAIAWCPDCGRVRAVSHDTSTSHVIDRYPNAVTEVSQYE